MRNAIKYYYNIEIDEIEYENNKYLFLDYALVEYYRTIDFNIYNMLIMNNIYVHKIIYNKNNEYITIIDNKPYILLQISKNDKIDIRTINSFKIPVKMENTIDWSNLWSNKIDYYEKNIDNVLDFKIKDSFNYYIGMAENAISLFKSLKLSNDYFVCHIRINNDIDFYNPLNLIIDYKVRDIAEYIKKEFFLGNNYLEYLKEYILVNYLSYNDCMLLLIRLLYPTYYFDCYDTYMKNLDIDYTFLEKIDEYEKFLKNIYSFIRQKFQISKINWLT